MSDGQAVQSKCGPDREIWREGDFYTPSIFVTGDNQGIGISVGGSVYVKPVRAWHKLAETGYGDDDKIDHAIRIREVESLRAKVAAMEKVVEAAKAVYQHGQVPQKESCYRLPKKPMNLLFDAINTLPADREGEEKL